MSVTFLDPPGALPSPQEPLDFTTTSAAESLVVVVSTPGYRLDEAAFVNGAFTARYAARSSWSDAGAYRAFTILREGGWIANTNLLILETALAHASTHVYGGSDAISGELLSITRAATPTGYTLALDGSATTNVNQLGSHLAGIENKLTSHSSTLTTLNSSVTTNTNDIAALQTLPHDDIASGTTTYSLIEGDKLRKKRTLSTTTFTLNVRTQATHAVTVDKPQIWRSAAAGSIAIVPAGGVTLNGSASTITVPAGKAVAITRISGDNWDVEGNFT